MYLPEITLALFSVFNVLRLGSYLPQIARIVADTEGAKAISYSTWCVWIGANGSTAAYALVNITDWTLFAVSAVNALGCAAVVVLTAWKRRQYALGFAALPVKISGVTVERHPRTITPAQRS